VSTPDTARRIQWLLWVASAIATTVFLFEIATSLDAELRALHHERPQWETAWFWMQVSSPIIAQLLLLPAFRRRGLLLPAASIFLVAVIACFLERPQHQRLALEARKKA